MKISITLFSLFFVSSYCLPTNEEYLEDPLNPTFKMLITEELVTSILQKEIPKAFNKDL
jgi:hypothetical protein